MLKRRDMERMFAKVVQPAKAPATVKCSRIDTSKPDVYGQKMVQITSSHQKACRTLNIQDRDRSDGYQYYKRNGFFITSKNANSVTRDGRRTNSVEPKYPIMRMTFFNGGKCNLPLSEWGQVIKYRALDIQKGISLFDNDFAYSTEGIRCFFELDYRSDTEPDYEDMLAHALLVQTVVKRFFIQNPAVDYTMWLLMSSPKPKYVKDQLHPIVAKGTHIIFPHIVIDCDQGKQLCHSANLALETEFGFTSLVDCCYHTNSASLRPLGCRKLETCGKCLDESDMRLSCEACVGRGKVSSGSIYTVANLVNGSGQDVYKKTEDLSTFVSQNLQQVLTETSIVTTAAKTLGYNRPITEPEVIPVDLRSKHASDSKKTHMYRADRKSINRRPVSVEVTCPKTLELICTLIKGFHKEFDHPNMVLASVSKTQNVYFVDLKGHGRTFCQICDESGRKHSSNRVFFRIGKTKLTQHCHNDECKKLLKSKPVRDRVTIGINTFASKTLFVAPPPKRRKVCKDKPDKFGAMEGFLDGFGK